MNFRTPWTRLSRNKVRRRSSRDKVKQEQSQEEVFKELESLKTTISQVEGERDRLRTDWAKYLQQNTCAKTLSKVAKPQQAHLEPDYVMERLIHKVPPNYPPLARQARIQGEVLLQAEVNTDGTVQNVKLISGNPMLAPAAIEAVKQWLFKPLCVQDEPVLVETVFTIRFTLSGG
jgi:TonB family protein